MNYQIDRLNNHPEVIPQVATLWKEALEAYSTTPCTQEELENFLKNTLENDALPTFFIALLENIPVAMCGLHLNYGVRAELAPWISDLAVYPDYQRQGIARALIEAMKEYAMSLEYEALHVFVFEEAGGEFYTHNGWEIFGYDEYDERPIILLRVMCKN